MDVSLMDGLYKRIKGPYMKENIRGFYPLPLSSFGD